MKPSITPPYLKKGDKVAIVSPARKITPAEIDPAVEEFKRWGLEVVLGDHIFDSFHQFAGTDEHRLADFQQMLDDKSIRAIICSRGGYGTVRIIDRLDFSHFAKKPKWIVGYSDVTVLHSHIHRHYGIETLHAIMPVNFNDPVEKDPSVLSMKKALFGEELSYSFPADEQCRKGTCEGELVGGNLSILYSITSTASDIYTSGKVLFLEDVEEYLYHIDRMMMNLKRSGKLDNLAGLIVGGMTRMNDNEVPYDKTAGEIITEAVEEFSYPVCYNFPAGHENDNRALILGRKVTLEVSDMIRLKF